MPSTRAVMSLRMDAKLLLVLLIAAAVVVLFVVLTSVLHGLFTPWLAPKFPKFFRHGYEPLFFNASLSFDQRLGPDDAAALNALLARVAGVAVETP